MTPREYQIGWINKETESRNKKNETNTFDAYHRTFERINTHVLRRLSSTICFSTWYKYKKFTVFTACTLTKKRRPQQGRLLYSKAQIIIEQSSPTNNHRLRPYRAHRQQRRQFVCCLCCLCSLLFRWHQSHQLQHQASNKTRPAYSR